MYVYHKAHVSEIRQDKVVVCSFLFGRRIRARRPRVERSIQVGETYLRTPSWFSILLMIKMFLPCSPNSFLTSRTSSGLRINDANTIST